MADASERLIGVNWHLDYPAVETLSEIMGKNVLEAVDEAQIKRSRTWRSSKGKVNMEAVMRGFLLMAAGGPSWVLGLRLGYYNKHWSGFLTGSGRRMYEHPKVKTQENGVVIDNWAARLARKTGFDEVPQLKAGILVVGDRAYKPSELNDQEILIALRESEAFGLDACEKIIVAEYRQRMDRLMIMPGLGGPYAALGRKNKSSLITRMVGNVAWGELASPWVDWRLFRKSFAPAVLGLGGR